MKRIILAVTILCLSGVVSANPWGSVRNYSVTVTNITKGVSFTPILSAVHKRDIAVFKVGSASSDVLATLAEGGNIAPLKEVLDNSTSVASTAAGAGLLMPGESVTFELSRQGSARYLSIAAMLLPTNDSFVGLNSVSLPYIGSRTYMAMAYDAGSEPNDELCANIPGPTCGGVGGSPDENGEGYVFPAAGISGEADLSALAYDWRGAVAKVVVRRMR